MPRRKRSTTVRWGENSFIGEQLSEGDLSFESGLENGTHQRSDAAEEHEVDSFARWRRKKIYNACPANSIILGEISISISGYNKIDFEYGSDDLSMLLQTSGDAMGFMLKISHHSDKKHATFHNAVILNEKLLKTVSYLFQHPFFWVMLNKEDFNENEFKINIATITEKFPLQNATSIVELFFDEVDTSCVSENQNKPKEHNDVFFKEVQNFQKTDLQLINKDVQHEILIHKLCSYQVRAVQWMLFRESKNLQQQNTNWLPTVLDTFTSKCEKTMYYNKYSGELYLELPNLPLLPTGGILADEMGLGKTLSIICLVLNNNRCLEEESDNDDFLLPNEQKGNCEVVIKSGSSLRCDDEVISNNKESNLSAHEKLVYNKVSKGSALKRALNEWYASKLAEYSAATPSKVRKMNNRSLKCVCGNVGVGEREKCVQCPECERFQHIKCVGFENSSCYFCPSCWPKQKLVKSSATLIVAPTSIFNQWFDEIKKHVKPEGLKNGVYLYDGLRQGFVQPSVLAKYDIVITTYGILRAEINHVLQNVASRKLRNEERYLKLCSPLRQIQWWRVCLDEAQMVENDCSQINQMAKLITSINRWSVTGTPIQKSVDDLYYLIDWLGVEPFNNKTSWSNLLYRPYLKGNKIPLYSVIGKMFWRNSKEDVAGELIIPSQTVKYHLLKFTAIEQNFYMREHAVSCKDFSETLRRLKLNMNTKVDSLDKSTFGKVLTPLLSLRQACSHPLAVKGNKISSKTGNMTLTELLEYLCNKTKVDCDEAVRKHISALNGLAGIYCIQENWPKAVEYYREVLQLCEEYKNKIQIDSLQRIHTITNLAEVLGAHSEGIPPTLRDESLKEEAKTLEEKYMQKSKNDLEAAENHLKELSEKISELEQKFESSTQVWWSRLIHMLVIDGSIGELFDKLSTELSTNEIENKKRVEQFLYRASSERGLEIVLRNWLSSIEDNRDRALSNLDVLKKIPEDKLLSSAIDCHLRQRRETEKKRKCQLCTCESIMFDYECSLFDVSRKVLKKEYEKLLDGCETKGSWRAKNTEKSLKVLLNVSKSKSTCEPWCLKDGRTHIQLLEAMKKEFKQIRAVWMSINHYVQACDELNMCKLRLRLRLPGESLINRKSNLSLTETNKSETIHILYAHEVESQKLKLLAEAELSKSEFRKKHGTLLYLRNLGQKGNPKPEPCPVCKTVLDNEWCVMQCGHSYCIDCIRILLMRSSKAGVSCPVCRETTKGADLSFIDLSGKHENSDINVVGDHSTKVEEIVRVLLSLKKSEPNVKVLIFSTWAVVLKILEVALQQNDVSFRRMPGHKYQVHIKEFRDPNLNVTALLLPISWGSKGLNLTEATHVFLVEPIMNPAEELQAIGRVHRIGQTKETVVHRFLIRSTIEEKIHSAVSEAKDKWGMKKVTLEDLQNLFDIHNDYMSVSVENDGSN